jgi:hypothetical protein
VTTVDRHRRALVPKRRDGTNVIRYEQLSAAAIDGQPGHAAKGPGERRANHAAGIRVDRGEGRSVRDPCPSRARIERETAKERVRWSREWQGTRAYCRAGRGVSILQQAEAAEDAEMKLERVPSASSISAATDTAVPSRTSHGRILPSWDELHTEVDAVIIGIEEHGEGADRKPAPRPTTTDRAAWSSANADLE